MTIVQILIGTILIIYGKKTIWLLIAVLIFIASQLMLKLIFPHFSERLIIICTLIFSIILALVVVISQKIALPLSGFLVGGYLAILANSDLHILSLPNIPLWLLIICGGCIGMLAFYLVFNQAIVIFSAFMGSQFVVQALPIAPLLRLILQVSLCIMGAYIQTWLTKPKFSSDAL